MEGISFQAYVSAFYTQNARMFERIRKKKIDSKYLMGTLFMIKKHSFACATKKGAKQVGLSRATLEFQVCKILSIVKISKLDPSVSKICCQKIG